MVVQFNLGTSLMKTVSRVFRKSSRIEAQSANNVRQGHSAIQIDDVHDYKRSKK